jgi:hypothetical protein
METAPTPQPLTIEELMQRIYGALKPFVEEHARGHLSIARDPYEMLELLGQAPGSFHCMLLWTGDKAFGDRYSGIVNHEFHVTVSHNRGLSLLRGESMYLGNVPRGHDDKPLVALLAIVRDKLWAMEFPDRVTDRKLIYVGTDPVVIDNTPIDAFTMTWTLRAVLPPPQP